MNPLFSPGRKHLGYILALVAIALVAWHSVFDAGFLSWDDETYTIRNHHIYSFSLSNIKKWFSNFYVGNYQPLTMTTYAFDYMVGGIDALVYHSTSLALHCVNGVLVYFIIRQSGDRPGIAVVTALLFILHPVQVESVTWIAERKTVLAGTFSLLAIAAYVHHLKNGNSVLIVYLCCFAAMLSKGTSVVLPFSLLVADLCITKSVTKKAIVNKLPILVLSIIFSAVALYGQLDGGFTATGGAAQPLLSRIVLAGSALTMYAIHLFVPIGLSAIYPYPPSLTLVHFAGFGFALLLTGAAIFLFAKKHVIPAAGIFFFIVNLIPVLQIVRFGEALMADRYLYLACLGLFYPATRLIFSIQRMPKAVLYGISGVLVCFLGILTSERNKNWINDTSFFNALTKEHPHSAVALYSAGILHMRRGDYDAAELLMQQAVDNEPGNYKAWYNKGVLHMRQGRNAEAHHALSLSISQAGYPKAQLQRAILYQRTGKDESAISDARLVLRAEPHNARAWYILATGLEKTNRGDSALKCYERAILYAADEPVFYIGHALALEHAGRKKEAILDLERATDLAPGNADAHYYLGLLQYRSGISPCRELQSAAALGLTRARQALLQLCH